MDIERESKLIGIVDDDESVLSALQDLMEAVGLTARCFGSAEEFLNSEARPNIACLITDVRMPGMTGIELLRHLIASNCELPVIFITAHGSDDHARREAASDWTVAYLIKPFTENALLDAVNAALQR